VRPVEAVDHFELSSQVFLGEMFEHPRVHQTLHEETSILWQTEARQPLVADPLMVHLTERQVLHSTWAPQR